MDRRLIGSTLILGVMIICNCVFIESLKINSCMALIIAVIPMTLWLVLLNNDNDGFMIRFSFGYISLSLLGTLDVILDWGRFISVLFLVVNLLSLAVFIVLVILCILDWKFGTIGD